MRLRTPRLPAMPEAEMDQEQLDYITPLNKMGIKSGAISAIVRNPQAAKAFRDWSAYTMGGKTRLQPREREVVAMRTIWQVKAGYPWSRHIPYGTDAGLTPEEMEAIKRPLSAHDWSDADLALLRAADALVADTFIPDDIWAELVKHFDERQIIDAIFVCGHFVMLSMFLNSAGTPIDGDVVADPELEKIAG